MLNQLVDLVYTDYFETWAFLPNVIGVESSRLCVCGQRLVTRPNRTVINYTDSETRSRMAREMAEHMHLPTALCSRINGVVPPASRVTRTPFMAVKISVEMTDQT